MKARPHPLEQRDQMTDETESPFTRPEGPTKERSLFVLEFTKEADRIKISGYEKADRERKTVRHYDEVKVDTDRIHTYNRDIIKLLNQATPRGRVSTDILEKLKTSGRLLYDEIFSLEIKRKLSETLSQDMIISVDDHLVNIPWELLHDGNSFFCLRFNMGRLVRTRQTVTEAKPREVKLPLKMFILSDPQGNLESAYQEGYSIRDHLEALEDLVQVNIKSSRVRTDHVLGSIRNYDMVHYAGHADYDGENPSNSGFLMEDGKLRASDIVNLIGSTPLPSLVFSNACKSGHTDIWRVDQDYEKEIYGLANAFLLAGVRHYIGTFWDIQDDPSRHFAMEFYSALMSGTLIGEAVRKARRTIIETYGEDNVIWASYVLYGDPAFSYVNPTTPEPSIEASRKAPYAQQPTAIRGGGKTHQERATVPRRNRNWIPLASGILVALSVLWALVIFSSKKPPPGQQSSVEFTEEARVAKEKRIDELVATLIRNDRERQAAGEEESLVPLDGPPTLVFLNIKTQGIREAEKEYILGGITDTLQRSRRVQVVEREVLDRLLEELKLSSSELADPTAALNVGRILSAQLISTGSILKEGREWQINLRLIETETTLIKGALVEIVRTGDKAEVAERLGEKILEKVKASYPLLNESGAREPDKGA